MLRMNSSLLTVANWRGLRHLKKAVAEFFAAVRQPKSCSVPQNDKYEHDERSKLRQLIPHLAMEVADRTTKKLRQLP